MAPSKWDDEEESTPPSSPPLVAVTTQRRKFDDEEDSDEVVEDWEAAEDSEVEREKAAKTAAEKAKAEAEALANKKSKAQRIQERMEQRRREQLSSEDDDDDEDDDEDAATQRARLRRTEQDADLAHAQDLIGDIDLNRTRSTVPKAAVVISDTSDPTKSIDLSTLPLFKPGTKTQFAELTEALIPLLTAQSKKPQYALWAQDFAKKLVKELSSGDIKKIASALTAVGNEKLKEEKAAEKGGKKSKAAKMKTSVVVGRDVGGARGADITAYDGDDLDDDDFM
ncbi:translation initiation factor 3 subunit J [[Emmonsia] crescens]|uniref:Eukaryotic translation initiation factor 3 subunit J n=1 Tax=[Emmonsia] crescens TaxID=73230 RepID=A0A0G2HNJ4_9EURO|nr:translation initiation factor 3 subunit J [Emmonsia crescens UAMH 3008]